MLLLALPSKLHLFLANLKGEFAMRSKPLIMALSLAAAAAVAVAGTAAFLTDRDTVTNTFTVGKVDITLDETKVNPDGTPVSPVERVEANDYHLIPGGEYVKDPTITVKAGSEESYVRMLVELNMYSAVKAIFGSEKLPDLPQNYVEGWNPEVWRCVGMTENGDTCTLEFRYTEKDASGNLVDKTIAGVDEDRPLPALFTKVLLPGAITGEQLATLYNDQGDADPSNDKQFTISVTAHAIQKATFENADAAWAAFGEQTGL